MKLVIVSVMALIAFVSANPVQISDNNVGDIITVGVNAQLSVYNNIQQDITLVLFLLLNQELGIIALDDMPNFNLPKVDMSRIPPQLIEQFKKSLTPEMIAQVRSMMTPENIERLRGLLSSRH
jgi:hypothetical protein